MSVCCEWCAGPKKIRIWFQIVATWQVAHRALHMWIARELLNIKSLRSTWCCIS
jgi:hypothetical protein